MIRKPMIYCIVFLFFMAFASLLMYQFSSVFTGDHHLLFALVLFFVSVVLFFYIRRCVDIRAKPFSLSVLFLLSYAIVFFQFPIDVYLGSYSDESIYEVLVFDNSVFLKSVWYALIFFIFICLG